MRCFPATERDHAGGWRGAAARRGRQEDGKFTVNVDEATLGEAAKLILGETLGYNYILDPRVQGSVTLVSNRPLSARELLNSFEAALRLAGAALIQSDGSYKIVALQEVLEGEMGQADLGKTVSRRLWRERHSAALHQPRNADGTARQLHRARRLRARLEDRQPDPDPRPRPRNADRWSTSCCPSTSTG